MYGKLIWATCRTRKNEKNYTNGGLVTTGTTDGNTTPTHKKGVRSSSRDRMILLSDFIRLESYLLICTISTLKKKFNIIFGVQGMLIQFHFYFHQSKMLMPKNNAAFMKEMQAALQIVMS